MIIMSRANQYDEDKKRLAALLEKHTGISASKTIKHIENYGAGTILSGASNLCKTDIQRQKLALLFEFKNAYETVKNADVRKEYILDSPYESKEYFKNYFADIADKEHVVAAFMDSGCKVITTKHISTGTINSAIADSRDIVKEALFCNAVGIIVAHNHPSGNLTVSPQDIGMTETLEKALDPIRVRLHDHIIVGGNNAVSLSDMGHLSEPSFDKKLLKVAFSEKRKEYSSGKNRQSLKKQLALIKSERSSVHKQPPGIMQNKITR